jgi:hypothetical protein
VSITASRPKTSFSPKIANSLPEATRRSMFSIIALMLETQSCGPYFWIGLYLEAELTIGLVSYIVLTIRDIREQLVLDHCLRCPQRRYCHMFSSKMRLLLPPNFPHTRSMACLELWGFHRHWRMLHVEQNKHYPQLLLMIRTIEQICVRVNNVLCSVVRYLKLSVVLVLNGKLVP